MCVSGHSDLIEFGFDFHYQPGANPTAQQTARQAVFLQPSTTPINGVEGRGELYDPGVYRVTQPPQVFQNHNPITAPINGVGTEAGGLYNAPLINTSMEM